MGRSLQVQPEYIKRVKKKVTQLGFPTQKALSEELSIGLSTISNFLNGRPVDYSYFLEISEALKFKWQEISQPSRSLQISQPNSFFSYDQLWVGRNEVVQNLRQKIDNSCRLLLILGLTGIGKTALAEKMIIESTSIVNNDNSSGLIRANFDYKDKPSDFQVIAEKWLEDLGENIIQSDDEPELLLEKLLEYFQHKRFLIVIDSLENLLYQASDEADANFQDPYWEKFFLKILSLESFKSLVIVTSQELPARLHNKACRYHNFYCRHILYGLSEKDQNNLFSSEKLTISRFSEDLKILNKIGRVYKGHPLVLRAILGEIQEQPFCGSVQAYWTEVRLKIEQVEKDLAEAEKGFIQGKDDEWLLHKLTRKIRNEINKERLESVFSRLEKQTPDAYILICMSAIYRIPVLQEGWLMQLEAFISRTESQVCSHKRLENALENLIDRFLVEESLNADKKVTLGQHNLIRSIALENYRSLVKNTMEKT